MVAVVEKPDAGGYVVGTQAAVEYVAPVVQPVRMWLAAGAVAGSTLGHDQLSSLA
jgi:hypothetical protein